MSWQSLIDSLRDHPTAVYVAIVLIMGGLLLVRVLYTLSAIQGRRKARLMARKRMDAISTDSPLSNSAEQAQDEGLESINRSTSVNRRLLVPLIIACTGLLATVPLLSRVPATMVSIVVAIGTVILGVAARPVIANAMSGLVLSFSRLINIGDTVKIEEMYGTIEDISMTHTTIKLWDWRRYVVPNSKMLDQSFLNYSIHDKFEWTYISFTVSYEVDIEKAKELALAVPQNSEHYTAHEPPEFWVMEMGAQGYEVWLTAWADTPSAAWRLRTDMREALIRAFQEHKIPVQRMRHEVFTTQA